MLTFDQARAAVTAAQGHLWQGAGTFYVQDHGWQDVAQFFIEFGPSQWLVSQDPDYLMASDTVAAVSKLTGQVDLIDPRETFKLRLSPAGNIQPPAPAD